MRVDPTRPRVSESWVVVRPITRRTFPTLITRPTFPTQSRRRPSSSLPAPEVVTRSSGCLRVGRNPGHPFKHVEGPRGKRIYFFIFYFLTVYFIPQSGILAHPPTHVQTKIKFRLHIVTPFTPGLDPPRTVPGPVSEIPARSLAPTRKETRSNVRKPENLERRSRSGVHEFRKNNRRRDL